MNKCPKKIIQASSTALLTGMLIFSPLSAAQQTTKTQKGETHALLMGGGTCEEDDAASFYNTMRLVHNTLIKQKVDEENIKVIYRGGKTLEHKIVDGDTTKTDIKNALAEYSNLSENDLLFIYRIGHGGLTWKEGKNGESITLSEIELENYDFMEQELREKNRITQEEFAEMMKNIKACKVVLLQQCHSGGFTEITKYLKKTVVIAAERKAHISKSWSPSEYWDLSQYICAAISGELNGKSVNADKNGDGLVSVIESFEFSVQNMPASVFGFIIEYNNKGIYSAYKERPQIGWSKDVDPKDIILGDYSFKDKNLPSNKIIGLRKNLIKLIEHTVGKGKKVMDEPIFGEEYQISRGDYTFSVNGRFFPEKGTPKTPENFVPLRITVTHIMKINPKTKEILKQKVMPDGEYRLNTKGKYSFIGCDGKPEYEMIITKSRDKEGLLDIKAEYKDIGDKEIEEYLSIINYFCDGIDK